MSQDEPARARVLVITEMSCKYVVGDVVFGDLAIVSWVCQAAGNMRYSHNDGFLNGYHKAVCC